MKEKFCNCQKREEGADWWCGHCHRALPARYPEAARIPEVGDGFYFRIPFFDFNGHSFLVEADGERLTFQQWSRFPLSQGSQHEMKLSNFVEWYKHKHVKLMRPEVKVKFLEEIENESN